MIDFLKLQTYNLELIDKFNNNNLLMWFSETEKIKHFDNEIITTKKVKQYKGIYFCFYSNKLEILFKPHYYFNANLHNANDFKVIDCVNVINEFKNTLQIDLNLLKVVNIEFGLNVISPIDIKDLINYLTYHERNEFRTDTGLAYSKKSYSINRNGTANQYKIIKAYAKGLQFPQYADINSFRFEVKSKKSSYINQLSIYNGNDLLNVDNYLKMVEFLIKEFKEVLLLDCVTNFENLQPKDQKKINEYNNPLLWFKIKNQNRNSFSKNKTNYYKLIDKVENNLKNQLEKIIFNKLEFLKQGANSTSKDFKIGCNFPDLQKSKQGANLHIYKREICTQKTNEIVEVKNTVCKITGFNISMQKENSNLLSHTGLRYYFKNDKEVFEKIKQRYLSKNWNNSDFEIQIKEIAHNIRNYKNNQKLKQIKIYQPQQYNFLQQF